jgi:hypothetical protein
MNELRSTNPAEVLGLRCRSCSLFETAPGRFPPAGGEPYLRRQASCRSWSGSKSTEGAAGAVPPTASAGKRDRGADGERQTTIDECGEDPDDDTVRNRFHAIQERLAELSEGAATWPDDIKANPV